MPKYRAIHYDLEKKQPWTKSEKSGFTHQEREFIRDIQISKKLNKTKAKEYYMNYVVKSKKQRRKIREKIISDVRVLYPKHKKTTFRAKRKTKGHKLPSGRVPRQKEFSPNYDNFEDWNEQAIIHHRTNTEYYNYIVKRHEKQPSWDLNELKKGKRKK